MTIHPITNREQLDEFLGVFEIPPYLQSWAWGEFQKRYGRRVWRLGVSDGDVLVGVVTVIEHRLVLGRSYLYVPHGPVTNSVSAARLLMTALRDLGESEGAMYVKLDPPILPEPVVESMRRLDQGTALQPRHTQVVDLALDEEAMLQQMHQKTRYNIRLAEKHGVTVRWSTEESDFRTFMELQNATASRQGIRLHSQEYYRAMFEVLRDAGMVSLGVADYQGRILAINEIVRFAAIETFIHGGSSDANKEVMAPYALQWQTIKRGKNKGAKLYDLRGIAPPEIATHPLSGVTRFKLGFGGRTVVYPNSRNIILDRPWWYAYRIAKRIRGGKED